MVNITQLILIVLTFIFGVFAYYTKKYLVPFINEKLTAAQRKDLYNVIRIGVAAAEQLYKSGAIAKNERIAQVKRNLEANGITYDDAVVNNMIEAAVLELPKTLTGIQEEVPEIPAQN